MWAAAENFGSSPRENPRRVEISTPEKIQRENCRSGFRVVVRSLGEG
jgi:hypothetical protein